ncbi:hypothetical protein GCM10011409_41870 [Lentibacillus populi]|uniref:Uncharacterized protein n=1 Tax=Lentibacillus populi TaxID=1827502 RepID=A0A9W5U257_9BACI|nr:hypothetical protein GCM10011409_41870 [Lentibacillus populi]
MHAKFFNYYLSFLATFLSISDFLPFRNGSDFPYNINRIDEIFTRIKDLEGVLIYQSIRRKKFACRDKGYQNKSTYARRTGQGSRAERAGGYST